MIRIPTTENVQIPFNILVIILILIFGVGIKIGYELKTLLLKYRVIKVKEDMTSCVEHTT